MIPVNYKLPDAYRGDTYGPITFTFNDSNGDPINLDGYRASLQFRTKKTNELIVSWDSIDGSMTVVGNVITMNAKDGIDMEIPAGTYAYDLQLTLGNLVRTYVRGDINVIQDVTDITE